MPKGMRGFQRGALHPNKGEPRTAGSGRKRGIPNRATAEVRELAHRIVTDAVYLKNLTSRAQMGELPGNVEVMLWAYAFGRTPDEPIEAMQRAALIFMTQRPLGTDPLAGALAVGRGSTATEAEVEAAENRAAKETIAELMVGPPPMVEDELGDDGNPLPDDLEELTLTKGAYQ